MKPPAASTTSLPRAPRDEVASRFTRYMITMGIRIACFILMAVVQPLGWYTWVFAAGAIFLPYFAVIVANVGSDARTPRAVSPERMIEAPRPADDTAGDLADAPLLIRLNESPQPAPQTPDDPPAPSAGAGS